MATRLSEQVEKGGHNISLIGPAPCYFERIRGLYRWHIILRGIKPEVILPEELPESWGVDIDPVSLL